tara:strand:+ start:394 stop:1110 length:717 start_codon:yes stop_codon:yes gene_type:complete
MLGLGTGFYGVGGKTYNGGDWLPSDESSLLAWYKFNTGITDNKPGVSQWSDSSGNGHHMLQATAGNRPTVSNGIITFDGSDDFLALASGDITMADESAFLIGFRVNPTSQNRILLGQTGSNTEMVKLGLNSDNLLRIKPGGVNADFTLSSGDVKDDAYWVISREAGAADLTTVYKDSAQVDATIAAPGEFEISQIGKRTVSSGSATENEFKGEVYEIMIFSETNADLIANVTARLASL